MFLKDRLLGEDIKIRSFSGVSAGTSLCILNELSAIASGVTQNPKEIMGVVGTGVKVDVASSSAADVMTSGTGAWQIQIYGLGPNFIPQTEILNLNGQTVVTSAKFWLRVFAASIYSVGTGLYAAGDIYMVATGTGAFASGVPATVTSGILKIPLNMGSGYSGYWTVPAQALGPAGQAAILRKAKIQALHIGGCAQNAVFHLSVSPNLETTAPQDGMLATIYTVAVSGAQGAGPSDMEINKLLEDFTPGTDIIMKFIPLTAGALVSGVLDIKMV